MLQQAQVCLRNAFGEEKMIKKTPKARTLESIPPRLVCCATVAPGVKAARDMVPKGTT